MSLLSQKLLPTDQKQARTIAKAVADNLVAIDQASKDENYKAAIRNYAETIRDLDAFLQLVPRG
jgi:ABC-type Zn uptake system ZnuABC Zn-binding protein ZnuA